MIKRFDPARLFERPRPPRAVTSDAAELDAVAAGKKPMAMFVGDDDEVAQWSALAGARNLVATCHSDPKLGEVHVFVTRADQLWRIPAYLALWETAFVDGRWSDGAENLASYLLGYSPTERKAWISKQRQAFPAWTAATVYAVLTHHEREAVEWLGRRSFGVQRVTLFTRRDSVLKASAFGLLPPRTTLARAGADVVVAQRLFRATTTRTLTIAQVRTINAALLSNVQFLTKSGWR